jgi:hypothetical protein
VNLPTLDAARSPDHRASRSRTPPVRALIVQFAAEHNAVTAMVTTGEPAWRLTCTVHRRRSIGVRRRSRWSGLEMRRTPPASIRNFRAMVIRFRFYFQRRRGALDGGRIHRILNCAVSPVAGRLVQRSAADEANSGKIPGDARAPSIHRDAHIPPPCGRPQDDRTTAHRQSRMLARRTAGLIRFSATSR